MLCDMVVQLLLLAMTVHSPQNLSAQFEQISRSARGNVGAEVLLIETGETFGYQASRRFPMQSVYKLPIGMAVLHEVDSGGLRLGQNVIVRSSDLVPAGLHSPIRDQHPQGVEMSLRELLRFMIVESDGTASDVLLQLAGGPERITGYLRGLGVHGVVISTSEKEMSRNEFVQYRNWATPDGMVRLLCALQEGRGLSASGRELLLQFMVETGSGPHRIRGLLPAGTVVAHKTGTSGTRNGLTRATNDVGIVTLPDGRHLALAVFVSDSSADDAVREEVIAKIARAAWDHWSRSRS